ncbi:MAG: Holliday junction resolvase RuvX [Chitinophagaceae bacterium]|jgi:putative Holliday junction resolvase|nr:Holliday junction resolvase RuvX [Chitinophagaceae bacterium]
MGRIVALDYGKKRTGIAVTDPLQIIATGLTTVESHGLRTWLKSYFEKEPVEKVIIGLPLDLDGKHTDGTKPVIDFIRLFKKDHPGIPIETVDEQFTSKMASLTLIDSGLKKKDRRKKELIDEVAATIMLKDYLEYRP